MQYSTKRRIMLGMTTGGLLVTGLGMSSAYADTTATGAASNSPGIGSGNTIQIPINAPVNICGNQIDVIGILDSVTGNTCENNGGTPGESAGGTSATGSSADSPGVGSGNTIQIPINAPVNVCGNQVDVIGILNSVTGNSCENNGGTSTPSPTPPPTQPTPTGCGCPPPPPSGTPTTTDSHGATGGSHGNGSSAKPTGVLAHTGSGALTVAPLGAGLIGGGALLRKRFGTRSH